MFYRSKGDLRHRGHDSIIETGHGVIFGDVVPGLAQGRQDAVGGRIILSDEGGNLRIIVHDFRGHFKANLILSRLIRILSKLRWGRLEKPNKILIKLLVLESHP